MENNLWFNQSGDLSGTQPSVIFQNNMIDGLSKFGNSFLINRRSVNNNTLKGLLSSRTDPRWQQLLKNKIAFIDMLLNTGGVRPSISKASSRMIPLGQTTAPQVPIRTVNSLSVPPVNDYSNVDAYCEKYSLAYLSGNGSEMNLIASTVASMYNISNEQAKSLLAERCLCNGFEIGEPTGNPCNDPKWLNLPMGGTIGQPNYNYGKNNYCDRCAAGTGSFPVSWNPNTGNWYYDQSNGTDYCSCCQPTNPNVDYSCENVPEEFCIQFRNATASGQTTALTNVVSTFTNYAANLGASLSYNEAYNILKRCCEQSTRPTEPTRPTLPPVPTKPTQTQIKNITNIATPTRGFDGEFMLGDY